ncbi:MAG: D-alanyl-D-alanine carboxypeptidase family protein [Acidimicrobiales bacterium]
MPARRLTLIAAALLALVGAAAPAGAQQPSPAGGPTTTNAPAPPKAWVLVDADSGAVLDGGQHHTPLPTASTVKLMTALTAVGQLDPLAPVPVSALAAGRPAMRIGMKQGEVWPLEQALRSMLMVSANDAAYAVAEASGGSLDGFALQMSRLGTRLGMKESTFNDPSGLDDTQWGYKGGSSMSAFDLAAAGRAALAAPTLAPMLAEQEWSFTGPDGAPHRLRNHNKLLGLYEGANGAKTGYTRKAGNTFVGAAERGGRTMVVVLLGTRDHYAWAAQLLDRGFATPPGTPGIGGEALPPLPAGLRLRTGPPPPAAPPQSGPTSALSGAEEETDPGPLTAAEIDAGAAGIPEATLWLGAAALGAAAAAGVGAAVGRRRR